MKYIFYLLFILTGAFSTWLFAVSDDTMFFTGIIPGLLFNLAVVIFSAIANKTAPAGLVKFFLVTSLIYIAIFYLTLFSSAVAFITGIITGGLGALAVFYFYSLFIKKISYKTWMVFLLGMIAFIVNDLFILTPLKEIGEEYFGNDMGFTYAMIFVIWQSIIGISLTKHIVHTGKTENATV